MIILNLKNRAVLVTLIKLKDLFLALNILDSGFLENIFYA